MRCSAPSSRTPPTTSGSRNRDALQLAILAVYNLTRMRGGCLLAKPQPVGHSMSLKTLPFSMRFGKIAVAMGLALGALLLTGCADDDQMAAQYVERPIEQIYSD